jgi:exopolyphosphatase/pppGpp-phosphohydrolase
LLNDQTRSPGSENIVDWEDEQVKESRNLGKVCNYDANHATQVCRLSLLLFDKQLEFHHLDTQARHWLECAAILHDIGWVEGWRGHHKASLRIILNTSLVTFNDRERHIIGSIARYHRGDHPKKKHGHYTALKPRDQQTVKKLSAILRLANAMDTSHSSLVKGITIKITNKKLFITCKTDKAHAEEDEKIQSQRAFFSEIFKHELKFSWENITGSGDPSPQI